MPNTPKCFAIYRGDKFVDVGTLDELAARTGLKKETLRFYATSVHRKRRPEDGVIVFRLEEEDED